MKVMTGVAQVNDTQIYFERAGEGAPVVFIHGFSLDTRMWESQFFALAAGHLVIRYDLRGFGRSALPGAKPYSHVEDLAALLMHMGIGRASLVGLSLGGSIAMNFTLTHPDWVDRLILVDAVLDGHQWSAEWDVSMAPIWAHGANGEIRPAKELWLTHPIFAPALRDPTVADQLKQIVEDYSGWHFVNHNPVIATEPPALARLETVRSPTLIIIGEDDLPDFRAISQVAAATIPRAALVVLPGVGHMANMEAPERVNELILGHLAGN